MQTALIDREEISTVILANKFVVLLMKLYSYVVRYDSGFAPNPFYGYCTLATCKPRIRKNASLNDIIIGVGSASKKIGQGGRLVYAMKVTEIISFDQYFRDQRFQSKKPVLSGSRKQARGDNIYCADNGDWHQLDSFHSKPDGNPNPNHIDRDTAIDRVLISNEYTYFGKNGPHLPTHLKSRERSICHKGRSERKFDSENDSDRALITRFQKWYVELEQQGYVGHPFDWSDKSEEEIEI